MALYKHNYEAIMSLLNDQTWGSGAAGVLYGQFELLNEITSVEIPLLPDVQQPLHLLFTAVIHFTAERQENSQME